VKNHDRTDLSEKGYIPIEDFVKEDILEVKGLNEELKGYERILKLNQYFLASVSFHQPGGDGYKLVLNCLQKYLDFKFIRENNTFRFDELLFDQHVSVTPTDKESMEGTRADIYYLLHEADQNSIASRRCINYVRSNRLHLTAVLVQLIERIVDNLEKNSLKTYREYARIIKTVYMTPEYAECDVTTLYEILSCTKKQYYRLRNGAISLLSETLFGIFAGEHGFNELYIRGCEIKISQFI